MTSDAVPLALLALLAFSFFLVAVGAKLPLEKLLLVIESNSREAAMLLALGMLLGFLLRLVQ